jgi:hypothetical protein
MSEYGRKHYQNNKQYYFDRNNRVRKEKRDYIRSFKDRPCEDCGISYPYFVMDLHHTDPSTKTMSPCALINRGWKRLIAEINSCIVLCANCHRIRTHTDEELL